MNQLDRVRVIFDLSTGVFPIMYYNKTAMLKKGDKHPRTGAILDRDETEDEFIARADKDYPLALAVSSRLAKVSDLPDMRDSDKFRLDANGNIFIDNTVVTEAERYRQRRLAIIQKFRDLGFTLDQLKLLMRS